MNLSKQLFLKLSVVILALISFSSVQAQRPVLHDDTRIIIHRTRGVIEAGQIAVAKGKVYTGDLARAVAHQHHARRLFMKGLYQRAIFQSLRARRLAFAAIKANRAEIKGDWQPNTMELGYAKSAPADAELDKEVQTENVDDDLKDDKAATTNYTDLDVQ